MNDENKSVDPTRGGRLVEKEVIDKRGNKVKRWVRPDEGEVTDNKVTTTKNTKVPKNVNVPFSVWRAKVTEASDNALENASKYAPNDKIRRLANSEILRRTFNIDKHLDMSLMPDFMLNDYVDRYNKDNIGSGVIESINKYKGGLFNDINKNLRMGGRTLKDDESKIVNDIDNAIKNSRLLNGITLYSKIDSSDSLPFINYLKGLKPGDVYEDEAFVNASLKRNTSDNFSKLYNSTNNITIRIYASEGQTALSLHNLNDGASKEKDSSNYEFILPRNQKFQVIENDGNELYVKML